MIDIVDLIGQSYTIVDHSSNTKSTLEHDSLVIWPESNSYHWFSRGIGGGPYHWLKYEIGMPEKEIEDYLEESSIFTVYQQEQTFAKSFPLGHKRYHKYIASRNITEQTATFFGLEVWNENILIPLYNLKNQRCGSMIRDIHTNAQHLKYRKIISSEPTNLWPYEFLKKRFDVPVFIFEGAWSVMRWYQVVGESIVPLALLGTNANNDTMELLNNVDNVTFIIDNDIKSNAGDNVYNKIIKNPNFKYTSGWQFIRPEIYPDEMSDKQIRWLLRFINERRG